MSKPVLLVTGATGLIGAGVLSGLAEMGGSRLIASGVGEEPPQGAPWAGKAEYLPYDLARPEENPFEYFHKPDKALHLAWGGLPDYRADFHLESQLPRQKAFLESLLRGGLGDLTVAGTCFEYGLAEGELGEEAPAAPGTAYARAKDELRRFLEERQKSRPFKLKWVRIFNLWGDGLRANSFWGKLERALERGDEVFAMSSGEQRRDFLTLPELAGYLIKITLQDKVLGVINCGSGQPERLRDKVEEYLRQKGKRIELQLGVYPCPDYEPQACWAKREKLERCLRHIH